MASTGTLFRDLLFFQGYVSDPELLRSLGEVPEALALPASPPPGAPAAVAAASSA